MKQKHFLVDYINTADIHAMRLNEALMQVKQLVPLPILSISQLSTQQLAFLDMVTLRFGKLQDIVGVKIMPLILEILAEDAITFIDKLNKLEKLGYISSSDWWIELRELRNQIAHDYPNNEKLICANISMLVDKSAELLDFWNVLKTKLANLVDVRN